MRYIPEKTPPEIQGAEVAYFDTNGVNRTYTLSRATTTSWTSNASGTVEGYAVWKINASSSASQNLIVRQYGYNLVSIPKTLSGAPITEDVLMAKNNFIDINGDPESEMASTTYITVNYSAKTVTVTASTTIQTIYDFIQYDVTKAENLDKANPLSTADGTTFLFDTDWDLIVTGSGVEVVQTSKKINYQGTGNLTVQNGAFYEDGNGAVWESSGNTYYASHIRHTIKIGATPIEGAELAYFVSASTTNQTYNLQRQKVTSLTSNATGTVEGYSVWKINTTDYSSQDLKVREYEYNLVSIPKTLTGAPITEDVLMSSDTFIVADETTAGSYTGIVIDYTNNRMIVATSTNSQTIYDYAKYVATLAENLDKPLAFRTADGFTYIVAMNLQLGNASTTGEIKETDNRSINFDTGYGWSAGPANGNTVNILSATWNFNWPASSGTFYQKYTFDITVKDSLGNSLEGVAVKLQDNFGTAFEELTNASGTIPTQIVKYRHFTQSGGNTPTEYGPHNLSLTKTQYIPYSGQVVVDKKTVLAFSLKQSCDPDPAYSYARSYPMSYASTTDTIIVWGDQGTGSSTAMGYDANNPISFEKIFEFGRAVRGDCAVQKPAAGTYAVLSQLQVGRTASTTQTTDVDFDAGTFATTTRVGTGEPAKVVLAQNASSTYELSGYFISSPIHVSNPQYGKFDFTISTSASTTLKFQLRSASTQGGLASSTWYGPTGTSDYYTTSGTQINSVHNGQEWIQYIAYLDTTDENYTPELHDATINFTSVTYLASKGESLSFSSANMPQLEIHKYAEAKFGDIADGIPQEGVSIKFTSASTTDELLAVKGGTIKLYDSYVTDVGNSWGMFVYYGVNSNHPQHQSDVDSTIVMNKVIFDRAARMQMIHTPNMDLQDVKINRVNSLTTDNMGLHFESTSNLDVRNVQIFHVTSGTGGSAAIHMASGMLPNTAVTLRDSILSNNVTDVMAGEEGRNVDLVNTIWSRSYAWGYSGSWDGVSQINESYGYLPKFVDTAGAPLSDVEIKALDIFGDTKFTQTSNAQGEIPEQFVPTWRAERNASGTTETTFNPYTVTSKKYGKKFVKEAKTFAARTVETKQLEDDPFITLTESQAQTLTGITYTPPTKVTWSDAETELVGSDNKITLDHTPIIQSEFFNLYDDSAKTLIPLTDYAVDYANGTVSFISGYASTTVRAVYSYGGKITLTNGTSTLSVDDLYAYLRLQKSDVFTTVNGSEYTLYVDLVIGNATSSGALVSPTKSITFASGYSYAFEGLGGYVDLGGLVASGGTGGGGGGLPLNISASTASFYYPGEQVAIFATVMDSNGQPVSATVNVDIYYPDGTLWTSVLAQEQVTGFFKATANLATSTPLGVYAARISATYQGNQVQTNVAFKVLEAPSDFPPSVTVDAPGIVKKDETFVTTAFIKSKSGIPINCDSSALITIRDLIAQSDVVSNAVMSNFATGRYSYAWSTATSSNYLAMVSCAVSSVSYLGVKEFSSQSIEPDALFIRTSVGATYAPGETVNVYSTVNNGVGEAVTATTTIEVYRPDGTLLTSGTSTFQYPGFYKFSFVLATSTSLGTYEVRSKAQTATSTAYDVDAFVVGEETRLLRIVSSVGTLYTPGETVNVYSTVYDEFNNLVSATTTVEVYKPDGTLLVSGTSTKQTTGFFKFSFTLATSTPLGTYEVRTKAEYNGREANDVDAFDVQRFTTSEWTVVVSDVGEVLASKIYRAKVWILDNQSQPTDPYSTPKITIYDANRNIVVNNVAMTRTGIGIYEYTYNVPSAAVQGIWETVVNTEVEQGKTIQGNDYWEVEGSPAQVVINAITDNTVPTITASTTITNEGSAGYEYQYEYCIVDSQDNQCNGGDDVDYGMGAKFIEAGQSWTTALTLNVPTAGTYWFKVYVYWGTERSVAVQQFEAVSEVTYTLTVTKNGTGSGTVTSDPAGINCGSDCSEAYASGTVVTLTATPDSGSQFVGWSGACTGTGTCQVTMTSDKSVTATFNLTAQPPSPPTVPGGAAVVSPPKPLVCQGADFNFDNIVNSTDFSILLYFWKTNPPFRNPCVDINKDNKVNSIDFSILLYQWGGKGIPFASKNSGNAFLARVISYGIIKEDKYESAKIFIFNFS